MDNVDIDELFDNSMSIENTASKNAKQSIQEFYDNYEYTSIPRIPAERRGADIIGLRTKATGTVSVPIGAIQPKRQLREIWGELTDVEKLILMYISEHRHLTMSQLKTLVIVPSIIRESAGGGTNVMKTYFKWVTENRYEYPLDYKATHKTTSIEGLKRKMTHLGDLNLIEQITPSYDVKGADSIEYKENPALFTQHYYLTPLGARVLICNTAARVPAAKGKVCHVGYVPTYRNAAYISIVHETESTEVLCSIIACAEYISNLYNEPIADGTEPINQNKYGFFDICRFYHEKDIEEKGIVWQNKKIDFKTDGKLVLYSSKLFAFIDYYIEYDSGSSTVSKIKHKIEAFVKYILSKRLEYGDNFRKPIMLMVTQKPSAFIPEMNRSQSSTYTKGIASMTRSCFEEYGDSINDIATVLVTDCNSIRQHGAMGACWHKMDLVSGKAQAKGIDLIEASKSVVS